MLRRNRKPLSKILGSCFSKIKKPNKYCLGNQTKFSIFLRNNSDCMVVDSYKRLDRVSGPDTVSWVLPNLGIAVDRVSCPDTDIGVCGTICIMCPILHEFVRIDLKCNGHILVLIEVELINFVCSKWIRSIWTKTNTNIITTWKNKRSVVWPLVRMLITSNRRSQQTPSAKGGKGKIQPVY